MKILFSLLVILLFVGCRKHKFNKTPEGYEEISSDFIYKLTVFCPDSGSTQFLDSTMRQDLINSQHNFDILFPHAPALCNGLSVTFPSIDFNTQSLIIGDSKCRGYDPDVIDTKVFANRTEKKILIRLFVRNDKGGFDQYLHPSFIIDKIDDSYSIQNEVINK